MRTIVVLVLCKPFSIYKTNVARHADQTDQNSTTMTEHCKFKNITKHEWPRTKEAVRPRFFGTVIYVVSGKLGLGVSQT